MNPVRRATPDSEAVASSEDERPWPSSTSFGSLPRKENGMPGLPGGIWSNQRRSSFKMSEAAPRNAAVAAREVRLGATNPHSALRTANTPSPAVSDGIGQGALPFAIPLQPTTKAGRSLSHSQGQREQASGTSGPTGAPALPLGLLTEEFDADVDSELGVPIAQTLSHPPIGTLQRASTYSTAFDSHNASRYTKDTRDGSEGFAPGDVRGIDAAFANLSFDHPHRRSQWQSHLGWDDVPNVNESRRHSLADIPTRRGSFDTDEPNDIMGCVLSKHRTHEQAVDLNEITDNRHIQNAVRYSESDMDTQFSIPDMYKVPYVEIHNDEMSNSDIQRERQASLGGGQMWSSNMTGRPRKQLFVVSFKCSRVDVFYLLENTGLHVREGDIVIVEADRGQDLGTVQHANVTPEQARLYKRKYSEEQYKWLMMYSRNNAPTNVNPNAQHYDDNNGGTRQRGDMMAQAPYAVQGLPRDNHNNLKPKAIKRLANPHEIKMLGEKEGNEAKAKRACQQKVAHLHLQMEILDAEWQWDFQKLIFYYYADHYINFKDLITDLYRIYKTRIWLSAVNPASFSQHAMGQPPSGIGAGAITGMNNTYTMAYGPDPDPYGAVPPYRIGYDTYTPNYPGIPGVSNSFEQSQASAAFTPTAPTFHPIADTRGGSQPVQFGNMQTGIPGEYPFYPNRGGTNGHNPMMSPTSNPTTNPAAPSTGPTLNPYLTNYYPSVYSESGLPPPGSANNRSADLGQTAFSPWNNGAAAARPNLGGLGRHSTLPPPIGTRPANTVNTRAFETDANSRDFGSHLDSLRAAQGNQGYSDRIFNTDTETLSPSAVNAFGAHNGSLSDLAAQGHARVNLRSAHSNSSQGQPGSRGNGAGRDH